MRLQRTQRIAVLLPVLFCVVVPSVVQGQSLVVDRHSPGLPEFSHPSTWGALGWYQNDQSFLADDFHLGKNGEVWIIDTIRTWIIADSNLEAPGTLNSLYSKITLYGGIADSNFSKDAKAPDCDCHGVLSIKTVDLDRVRWVSGAGDLKITDARGSGASASPTSVKRLFQAEFTNLHWSVPGGDVQFGIQAIPRSVTTGKRAAWTSYGKSGEAYHVRVFSKDLRLASVYDLKGVPPRRISVQVWAHLSANVSVHALLSPNTNVCLSGLRTDNPSNPVSVSFEGCIIPQH